jgi:hypothetical protein
MIDHDGADAEQGRALQSGGIGAVTDHGADLHRQFAVGDRIEYCLEIAATP